MGLTYGPRFNAFLPLGNKARLESQIFLIAQRLPFSYQDIMSMPSSRRERFAMALNEIIRNENNASSQQSRPRSRLSRPRRR